MKITNRRRKKAINELVVKTFVLSVEIGFDAQTVPSVQDVARFLVDLVAHTKNAYVEEWFDSAVMVKHVLNVAATVVD